MKASSFLVVFACLSLATSVDCMNFGPPVPVEINTDRVLHGMNLSPDELTIYFHYNDGQPNSLDIFYATRPDKNSAFSTPVLVPGMDTVGDERHPCVSTDGLTIYYNYSYPIDIYTATRDTTSDPFDNKTPLTTLSSSDNDWRPSVTDDELIIVFGSNRSGGLGAVDLYMATRPDTSSDFSAPVNLTELNSSEIDSYPNISSDGRAIVFTTRRANPYPDIYMATRPDTSSPFEAPFSLGNVINLNGSSDPYLSRNGRSLYFVSERDGSLGGNLWMAQVIPEPSVLLVMGFAALAAYIREKRKHS